MTLVSRLLGFARDLLLAAALGAGPVADAFYAALRFPNLFRRLFAEGAFSQAFVPVYSKTLAEQGEKAADTLAGEALAVLRAGDRHASRAIAILVHAVDQSACCSRAMSTIPRLSSSRRC